MITFFRDLPAWLLVHPWTFVAFAVLIGAAVVGATYLNPQGRQVRKLFRRCK